MLKVWFNRELQSEQTRLTRKQLVDALWQKYVVDSKLTTEETLTRFTNLLGFLSGSIPTTYFGDRTQYAEAIKQNFATAIKNKDY